MTLQRRLTAVLALAFALMIASAGVAHATAATDKFKAPRSMEAGDGPRVVMDATGTAHLVDVSPRGVLRYWRIPRGGSPSAPRALADNVLFNDERFVLPELGIDSSRTLHILWNGGASTPEGSIQATRYYVTLKPDGTLSAPLAIGATVDTADPIGGLLQVEPNGRAHVVWNEQEPSGEEVARHVAISAGRLGPVATVVRGSYIAVANDFGVDGAGVAHVAYRLVSINSNDPQDGNYVRTVALDGRLGAPVRFSPATSDRSYLIQRVLVASDGTAHVITASFSLPGTGIYYHSIISPAGVRVLDRAPLIGSPKTALDRRGRLHVLAKEYNQSTGVVTLRYAIYSGATRTTLRTLVEEAGELRFYAIGIGPTDEATLVWSFDKASSTLPSDIYAVRPGSSSKRNISRESRSADFLHALAVGPTGGAIVVWEAYPGPISGRGQRMYASTYD